jgi:hypothetical protein
MFKALLTALAITFAIALSLQIIQAPTLPIGIFQKTILHH